MDARERPSDAQGGDTLPEFPAVVDRQDSDFPRIARRVRRRNAVRHACAGLVDFVKEVPEMVFEFITGLWP